MSNSNIIHEEFEISLSSYTSIINRYLEKIDTAEIEYRGNILDEIKKYFDDESVRSNLTEILFNTVNKVFNLYRTDSNDIQVPTHAAYIGKANFPVVNNEDVHIHCAEFATGASLLENPSQFYITTSKSEDKQIGYSKSLLTYDDVIRKIIQRIQYKLEKLIILNFISSLKISYKDYQNIDMTLNKVKGNSFHFAAVVGFLSFLFDHKIPSSYFFTGSFDAELETVKVGEISKKIDFILGELPRNPKIFIPFDNFDEVDADKKENVIPIKNLEDLVAKVFNEKLENLIEINIEKISKKIKQENNEQMGYADVIKLGTQKFTSFVSLNKSEDPNSFVTSENFEKEVVIINFYSPYQSFTLMPNDSEYVGKKFLTNGLIVVNGKLSNFNIGYLAAAHRQLDALFCFRIRQKYLGLIFANPNRNSKKFIDKFVDLTPIKEYLPD